MKRVEYLESNGTQYIDTGLLQQGFHILVDVEFSNFSSIQIISGTYGYTQSGTGQDSYRYYLRANTNGSIVTQFGGSSGNNLITGATLNINTQYKIEAKLFNGIQELRVNDVLYGQKAISGRSFPNKNIFLFANHDVTANTASNFCSCKIYSAKYYDNNGTMIRDYVPILDDNDVPCLYDAVNNVKYYNAGTGTFSYGNVINEPSRVEYLESSNNNQFVHTGIPMSSLTKIEIDLQATRTDLVQGITGRYTSNNTSIQIIMSNSNGKLTCKWGANSYTVTYDTNRHKIELSKTQCIVDGTVLGTYEGITPSDTSDLLLFARRTDNSGSGIQNSSAVKIYSCKMYADDILVRDFLPMLDDNGVPCMYDQINNQYYYHVGQTPFLYGDIVEGTSYVGISNLAQKVKKIYVGIGGIARKVVKAYVGVYGIARKFFELISAKTVSYYGQITNLSENANVKTWGSMGDYSIFFCGQTGGNSSCTNVVELYDKNLTHSLGTSADEKRRGSVFAKTGIAGNYGCFTGGLNGSTWLPAKAYCYDSNLTRTSITMQTQRNRGAGASSKSLAIFYGSERASNQPADAIDENLTVTVSSLPGGSYYHINGGARAGDYAVFPCAYSYKTTARIYDDNLTLQELSNISAGRFQPTSATMGNKAVFAGGNPTDGAKSNAVDIYDEDLVHTSTTLVATTQAYNPCTNMPVLGGYMMCGNMYTNSSNNYTVFLNEDMTSQSLSGNGVSGYSCGGIGDYFIVCGGNAYNAGANTAYAYKLI